MSCADDAASALLPHVMVPAVGSLRPAISRSAVDLPHPEGPSSETNSPGRTSRSSPSSAWVPLAKVFDTPRSATSDGPAAGPAGDDEGDESACTTCLFQPSRRDYTSVPPSRNRARRPLRRGGARRAGALSLAASPASYAAW